MVGILAGVALLSQAVLPCTAGEPAWRLETQVLPNATVYQVWVDLTHNLPLRVSLPPTGKLQTVVQTAEQHHANVVLNGGFFDPVNRLASSYVAQEGQWVASPQANPHLMQNPALTAYLPAILNRSELRLYTCGLAGGWAAIAVHHQTDGHPSGCQLQDAVGAGPQLFPRLRAAEEGFVDTDTQGRRIRDPIGVETPNARSAVGLMPDGRHLVLVMVAQHVDMHRTGKQSGMTLAQLSVYLKALGVKQALSLDGGSSSSLVVNGIVYWGKQNTQGQPVKRAVQSCLWLPIVKAVDVTF